MFRALSRRLYADYLMPSRLPLLEAMLREGLAAGYTFHSLGSFHELAEKTGGRPEGLHVILRHDIDTDVATARAMWDLERKLGILGSFFFRLSTIDAPLMKEMEGQGAEASYHFEEIATWVKQKAWSSKEQVASHLEPMQADLLKNLERLRSITGLPMRVLASHGDFANRKVGVMNHALLEDAAFRRSAGVALEAYDEALMGRVSARTSDVPAPRFWSGEAPEVLFQRREPVVHILLHPKQWRTAWGPTTRENVIRLWEGLSLSARSRNGGHR